MWGECIYLLRKEFKDARTIVTIGSFIVFVAWMIFRIYNTYEDTSLMPYIFEPLYSIMH